MVHEFGHALMSKVFNCSPSVVLWGMGGLCYSQGEQQTPRQRLAVVFAGPGAGFLLFGVVVLLFWIFWESHPIDQCSSSAQCVGHGQCATSLRSSIASHVRRTRLQGSLSSRAYWFLVQINLFWGLVNLLPVWPLDGGQATQILLTFYDRSRGQRWGHVVSLLVAGAVALVVVSLTQRLFLDGFLRLFCLVNYQVLQTLHQAHSMGLYQDDEWWRK